MSRVLVTGAAGTLGSKLVWRLSNGDHAVRAFVHETKISFPDRVEVFSGDIHTGQGLRDAVADVDAIVHCASSFGSGKTTDVTATRKLIDIAAADGAPHLVYISIVGTDQITAPYFQEKYKIERLIERCSLPFSILRSTQFHEFVAKLIPPLEDAAASSIAVPVALKFQPIDAEEVARVLATIALSGPVGHAPEMGGPETLTFEHIIDDYVFTFGLADSKRALDPAEQPEFFAAFREGLNLTPDRAVGQRTWRQYLDQLLIGAMAEASSSRARNIPR